MTLVGDETRLDRRLVALLAVATGLSVASNYYAQPLLPAIGRDLHMSSTVAGLMVTVAQVGYALGLVVILPLGDLLERRRLIVVLSLATAAGLVWLGASPGPGSLLPAALAVGALSVVAQVLVPFSASLAPAHERGRVVGLVMSGLLVGVLLARTVAGWLADAGSWRLVYFVSGGAMLVQAGVLARRLPNWKEDSGLSYRQLVQSVGSLMREEPVLRLRATYGFLSFGAFSVLWTSLAFVLSHRYGYTTGVIGMFGLAGAAGAMSATLAGRLSDRGWAPRTTAVASGLMAISWVALWAGRTSLAWLLVGILAIDGAAQALHITNQGEIYRLRPEARSRLTSAYMVTYFVGGATGSLVSASLYSISGWTGVCLAGAGFGVTALALSALMQIHRVAWFTA